MRRSLTLRKRRFAASNAAPRSFKQVWQWLIGDLEFAFATLVVEESPDDAWSLIYVFYREDSLRVHVEVQLSTQPFAMPSVVGLLHGPSADWHEREAEDLFGMTFEGHPRLGEFVLHEDWPEGVNPMRRDFDARRPPEFIESRSRAWNPPTDGRRRRARFAMPIGPVFSDFAESAHFLLETVGEDVIRTIPRFFYKYRGVEKIAEGAACRPGLAARRAILRHVGFRARLGVLSGRRDDLRNRGAAARAGAPYRVCRTRAAAPSRGGDYRHLQLDGIGGRDQPSRADRRGFAAAEL